MINFRPQFFKKWKAPLIIVWASYFIFIFLVFLEINNSAITTEHIRAFCYWTTMTIGAIGLYVAIQKFGIDFDSHTTKRVACVLTGIRKVADGKNYHYFTISNRTDRDIYLKDFDFSDGTLCLYGSTKRWDKETKIFLNEEHGVYLITPNQSKPFEHLLESKKNFDFKMKIHYTFDDYHGEQESILFRIKQ